MIDEAVKTARLDKLTAAMEEDGIDAVALVPGANFYFLTGAHFHLMERPTVLFVRRDGTQAAVIPVLEKARWQAMAPEVETVFWQDSDGYAAAFGKAASAFPTRSIGVEGQRMRVFEYESVRSAFGNTLVRDAHDVISRMRLTKDDAEIEIIRKAIAISEAALGDTIARVAAGQSEAEVRAMLIAAMLDHGADGVAFDPIVLAGGASADPHGTSDAERRLEPGGALLIDYGAAFGGYAADITRTFFVERVSERHRDIYEAVRRANESGRTIARPGMTMDELDRRVTAVLREAGFPELVVHKTGHGLGLDVHEAPQVMVGNMQRAEPGMVFTIEPGLYSPNDVGVRIEDDFLVLEEGGMSLTGFDRSLKLVG